MPAAITYIRPLAAYRGEDNAHGTPITIAGTGFEAAQGGGGVTIGAVAAHVVSWSDTAVVVTADSDPATPLGPQDVVLTTDGGSSATGTRAVYIYDETDKDDHTEIKTGKVADFYLNGLAVGYLKAGSTFGPTAERLLPFTPQDKQVPAFWHILERSIPLQVVLAQIDGSNLAAATGGSYDGTSRILSVEAAEADKTEYAALFVLTNGVVIACPRCLIEGLAQVTLQAEDWQGLPLSITAVPVDDADAIVAKIYVP